MRAIQNSCKFEVIQLLIQYEANVNMLTNDGNHIFDFIARNKSPQYYYTNKPLVKLILISGFDLKLLTQEQ